MGEGSSFASGKPERRKTNRNGVHGIFALPEIGGYLLRGRSVSGSLLGAGCFAAGGAVVAAPGGGVGAGGFVGAEVELLFTGPAEELEEPGSMGGLLDDEGAIIPPEEASGGAPLGAPKVPFDPASEAAGEAGAAVTSGLSLVLFPDASGIAMVTHA